ncbi:MAG TPA: hypothetical protein VFS31_13190 [Chitinophagaceae bacterium]|jgi:hypothetical protein|nr:hypothetical protein [Chitinophagaceae bacterium]
MILEINDTTTISDLQLQFSTTFPYLRLVFLSSSDPRSEGNLLASDLQMKNIPGYKHPGWFEILPSEQITEIESILKNQFGLRVEIERLHANEWVSIHGTRHLTLREHNNIGRHAQPFEG